jgi:hypothetical protein
MATWQDFAASYGDTGPIGKLSGVHNSKLFDTMANQIAKAIGYTGKTWVPGTYEFENANEGGTFMDKAQGKTASPEFLKALEAYQFSRDADKLKGTITDTAGQSVGNFTAGNKDTGFDKFAEVAVPLGLAAIAGGAAGLFGPVGGGAAGGAAGSAGAIGAGEGAAQLAAYTAANPLTAAQVTASMLPAGGLPGLGAVGGGLLASVPAETLASLEAFTAANPVTMAEIAATVPNISMPAAGITSGALESLNAYSAANPVAMPEIAATMPELSMPAMSSAAPAFNAAADSQLASSQLGITGAQSAAAATAPATVNLGSLGGTMGTAGGISGALAGLKQQAADTLGGGLLGDATTWMKNNPVLGRLIMSGATGLLSGAGGSSGSSGAAQAPSGPPVQWNSNLQQGLLSPVQQYAPPAVQQQRPAGLLAQGYANDGAWRYLKG